MGGYSKYDDLEYLPEEVKNYIQEINYEIVACFHCQPYDKEDGTMWVYGNRYEICDYFYENDIPEEYWNDIIPYMDCPQCGRVFEDQSDEVGIMGHYETEYQQKYDEIVEKTKDRIQSFYNFLSKFPYLGLEHEVGQEISKEINKMPLIIISNEFFYRARKPENGKIFIHEDMLNPPQSKSIPEGRFNHFGQSHLYLGDSEELCAKEITNEEKELLWMQKYKINHLEQILDVSIFINQDNIDKIPMFFSGLFESGIINVQKSKEISWAPEYFIPRFISDIARNNNINGIIYNSTKTLGRNLVIFNLEKCVYEFAGDPYTYIFDRKLYKEPLF